LFSGVKAFADKCSRLVEEKGHICNPFGFRGTPEPHKAYNWVIQSSINTVINLMLFYLMKRAPYAKFVTCVHDELIVSLKETDKERFDTDRLLAEQDLNNHLKLSVPIRTGCVFGNNLYEAK
jgi:DNA polymerase I-like protein with 3'-5' exonuclease and polymerase domains